ncbi:MAG TPA: FtsX-like permease family protein, partial [Terriglobales bacterium]
PDAQGIKDWRSIIDRLQQQPHVLAASGALYEPVLISRGGSAQGAQIKGIVPEEEARVSDILKSVNEGSAAPLADASAANQPYPPILLGQDLAKAIGTHVGELVMVTSPQGELSPFGMVPKYVRYRVVGTFKTGFYDYDNNWAFTSLASAQKLFGLGDEVADIEVKLDDLYLAPKLADSLARVAGPGLSATNWMEQNPALFRALRLERLVSFISIGLIVLVAALNILTALVMLVMEKTKDIAVLIAMGVRRAQIRRIFILQGMLIGAAGTSLGLVLGYTVAMLGAKYHFITLSAEVYSIDYVPFAPRVWDGVLVALVALAISLAATIYPSYAAARILPAEALRYE